MTPWSPCPRCTHSMAVHRLVADKVGYRCQVFVSTKRKANLSTVRTCRCRKGPTSAARIVPSDVYG